MIKDKKNVVGGETGTEAGGLRMQKRLWRIIRDLAKAERRKVNQYIEIVLEDHAKSKGKL